MTQAMKISGIKCDTPHCNYRDDTIQFEDYPKWINKPCPVCSRNLLTQSEYDQCIRLFEIEDKLNKFMHKCRWLNPMFYYNRITGRIPKVYETTYNFPKRKIQ